MINRVITLLSTLLLLAACGLPPAEDLETILSDNANPEGPATIVYVSGPEGTMSAAIGYADGTTQPAQPDDLFRIGSVSKMFTAVATLQLVDEGVLSLDDTAADWISVPADLSNGQQATIEQLLNHSSGIPDYLDSFFIDDALAENRQWQAVDTLDYATGYAAEFPPGQGFSYSNTNYILLELIVEAASGQSLHGAIRSGILTPLNLTDTYTQVFEQGEAPVRGYEDINTDGTAEDVTTFNDGAGLGDGGLISNGADVAAFLETLVLEGRLLTPATREAMLTDYGSSYGLGIEVEESAWGPQIGHSGAVTGYASLAYTFPDYETTVVVLTGDIDGADLSAIVDDVMNMLYP